jgi:hypothetical protein
MPDEDPPSHPPADLDAIIRIGHQTWPSTYAYAGPDYIAHGLATWWSRGAITQSLTDTTVLVADDNDHLTGIANLDLRGTHPPSESFTSSRRPRAPASARPYCTTFSRTPVKSPSASNTSTATTAQPASTPRTASPR